MVRIGSGLVFRFGLGWFLPGAGCGARSGSQARVLEAMPLGGGELAFGAPKISMAMNLSK